MQHPLRRDPRRARNIVFLVFVCAATATTAAFMMPDAGRGLTFQTVLGISGILVTPVAFVFTLIKAVDTRRLGRLLRGEGVVARWQVDAASWQAFVRNEKTLDQQPGRRPNLLSYQDMATARDVEVIVGRDALLIGGEFHAMSRRGLANLYGPHWLPGTPTCIQFDLTAFISGGTHAMRWVLRFPVARGAEAAARQVIAQFQTPASRKPARDPLRSRNLALATAGISAIAFGVALMLRPFVENQDALAGIAVTGVLVGLSGLILALAWHLDVRRARSR